MNDEISIKLLSQATENIQKLFELSTRIDERVKTLKENDESLDERLTDIERSHSEIGANLKALSFTENRDDMPSQIAACQRALIEIDKRLLGLESTVTRHQTRWEKIGTWVFQLIWVILLAWLLSMLRLQAPPSG